MKPYLSLTRSLRRLMGRARPCSVRFVGAGPGDAELLTLRALRALEQAEIVIHDRLIGPDILDLAPKAHKIDVGKTGFGPSVTQAQINALIVEHGASGKSVVRLKGGDPTIFGRLDEELDALEAAGLSYEIVPGITAASAALAGIGQSMTKRGRNTSARILTGHDMAGFADHDWRTLAAPGQVAAIYMGKKAAQFISARLMMHGAAADTPVTIVENASRSDARSIATTLSDLPEALPRHAVGGPALLLLGLAPRDAQPLSLPKQEAS